MFKKFSSYLQYILPQHALTTLAGKLANARTPWLKNLLIDRFIRAYNVDLSSAQIENPHDFATFNDFFTRKLKPELRPIAPDPDIAFPVDGMISQIGRINKDQLLQAKGFYYTLQTLLGNDTDLCRDFADGSFAALYLAPHNYHRVHMPMAGKLIKTIYIPGNLFSVNNMTTQCIPDLFTRNERLVCIFETEAGPMAVILVGAIIVGSIQMVWQNQPYRGREIFTQTFTDSITIQKGAEAGLFKLGSTVIVLFAKDKAEWVSSLKSGGETQYGAVMGCVK